MTSLQKFAYNGTEISFDLSSDTNLMINASEMAKGFGKQTNDFLRLKQTKTYIQALECRYADSHNGNKYQNGNSRFGQTADLRSADIYKTIKGGNNPGTWMHRKLAIRFAQWLSPEFAIWVDGIIEDILLGNRENPNSLDLDSRILAKEMLVNDLEVAEIIGLTPIKSKITVVNQIATITGVDYGYILKDYIDQVIETSNYGQKPAIEKPKYLSATELAEHFNYRSPQEVNKFLERMGMQIFDHEKQEWIPTREGKEACKREKWLTGSDHHLKWNPSLILQHVPIHV